MIYAYLVQLNPGGVLWYFNAMTMHGVVIHVGALISLDVFKWNAINLILHTRFKSVHISVATYPYLISVSCRSIVLVLVFLFAL